MYQIVAVDSSRWMELFVRMQAPWLPGGAGFYMLVLPEVGVGILSYEWSELFELRLLRSCDQILAQVSGENDSQRNS